MAPQSAIGVAQAMASTPFQAFRRNINGTSSPPLRSIERMRGFTFWPTDWKMEIMTVVMAVKGPVMQIMRWNILPYRTVSASFMNARTRGPAQVNSRIAPTVVTERLRISVTLMAERIRPMFLAE